MKSEIRDNIIWKINQQPGMQDDLWTEITPDLPKSKGIYLKDLGSNKPYLDLNGFFGSAPLAYDHPALKSKEFRKKLISAATYRPSLADFWTQEMAEFVDAFRRVALPAYPHHFDHFFFIEGGSLAIENALKAAFDWKVRTNMKKGLFRTASGEVYDPQEDLQPLGTKVLGFEHAFHGRSGYTLSLTHTKPEKYKYFPKFPWLRSIEPPVLKYDNHGKVANRDEVERLCREAIAAVRAQLTEHAHDIGAIIIEPIQCEGGDRHIPSEFFVELRKLANEFDAILIYDEVQTGIGATGKMWAHEYFGIEAKPDIIAFAKKAQVSGIIADSERFAIIPENVFANTDASKSRINSTWGGNPADMVRSTVILETIAKENLVSNAANTGKYFLKGLCSLCQEFPKTLSNPRGLGLLLAVDINPAVDSANYKMWQQLRKEHVLSLICGKNTVRFRPHLDISHADVDEAISRLHKAVQSFEKKYRIK